MFECQGNEYSPESLQPACKPPQNAGSKLANSMLQGYHSSGILLSLANFFPTFHLLIFVLAAVARKRKRTCEKGCSSTPHFPRGDDCHPRLPLIC